MLLPHQKAVTGDGKTFFILVDQKRNVWISVS
jgi:hypothetical protein